MVLPKSTPIRCFLIKSKNETVNLSSDNILPKIKPGKITFHPNYSRNTNSKTTGADTGNSYNSFNNNPYNPSKVKYNNY